MILLTLHLTGDGLLAPSDLPSLIEAVQQSVPDGGTEPIILSGRLPVWAYAALAHFFHPRPWVATFEPRLQKAVVVASHTPGVRVGDTVDVSPEDPDSVRIAFP